MTSNAVVIKRESEGVRCVHFFFDLLPIVWTSSVYGLVVNTGLGPLLASVKGRKAYGS